jgi:hypothetical protein
MPEAPAAARVRVRTFDIPAAERSDGEWVVLRKLAALQVTVRVEDVGSFVSAAKEAGWSAVDSGERVTTDDGIDKEAVLVVRIPVEQRAAATAGA